MAATAAPTQRRIGSLWIALGVLLIAALLAGLAWHLHEPPVTARPSLWRISKGDRRAWLFGTIHAVPRGARWMSPAIENALDESDELLLEASGLEAERNQRTVFEALGRSPNLPAVSRRLPPADRARLAQLQPAPPDLDRYESWAAALLISAAANQGLSQEDAGEARFESRFRSSGKSVRGLETIQEQLGAFDTLPEPDQRALLAQAVNEAGDAAVEFQRLYRHWSSGDLKGLEQQFIAPLEQLSAVRKALIDQRNARWTQQIDALLRGDEKVRFVAVGTGHLLGTQSVQARLAALGWKIERVQ